MGHFSETLMAVCSTPSSPLRVVFPAEAATLLKFLLTETAVQRECFSLRALAPGLILNTVEVQVQADVIKMYLYILTIIFDKRRHTLGDAVFCRKESFL